jgi:hypothetical protein
MGGSRAVDAANLKGHDFNRALDGAKLMRALAPGQTPYFKLIHHRFS